MNQLRIVFTCMCAYLPRRDDVLVVIPDGRSDRPGEEGHHVHASHGPGLPPHIAAIQFDPADLSLNNKVPPDLVFRRPDARRDQGILFLTGQDITLDPAPKGGAPAMRGGRKDSTPQTEGEAAIPQTEGEAGDFSWVADISQLDATAGVMDPECAAPGNDSNRRVVARMSLQGGSLGTLVLGRDSEGRVIGFDFVKEGNVSDTVVKHESYKQALAAAVAYDVAVPGDEVTLVLTPFKNGEVKHLVFSFAGSPMGHTLQILIKNMPLDSLLEVTHAIDPLKKVDVDAHFEMYYVLSKEHQVENRWIPFSTKARAVAPVCPSARFVEQAQ